MVAYSFKSQFEEPIVAREKRQTVRGFRKRHARPGEPIQLYVGMRTRNCRKILTPDPICVDLRQVLIAFDPSSSNVISAIEIDGFRLGSAETHEFAIHDGFGPNDTEAVRRMGQFWLANHGSETFAGVVIRWRDA
tara:strand:- start:740 stop:1144 length:405 start_codon:yes stop_codon:yes gene_type:complete